MVAFTGFMKEKGGTNQYRMYSKFGGKTTHIATRISIKHFKSALQKRILKTVRLPLLTLDYLTNEFLQLKTDANASHSKKYGSIQSRKKVEKQRKRLGRTDSDYGGEDSEEEGEANGRLIY